MKISLLPLAFCFLLGSARAQSPATPPRREPLRLVSPEVAGQKVTFRFNAPKAQAVSVRITGRKEPVILQKDERGIWSGTLENLAPEIYDYHFEVDGLATLDPANPWVKSGLHPTESLVEVPAHPAEFWEARNVPHGLVTMHTFQSKALGAARTFRVYTPPGYDQQPDTRFPVLYLLHGSGDLDDGWTVVGRAHLIADNLLAAKKAKPLIIVMPNGGYPRGEGHEHDFENDLLGTIAPMVESHYRIAPGAKNCALAGLSMGGFQTLDIGIKNMDRFAWLGVFSAGIRNDYEQTHGRFLDEADSKLALFWIGIGEDDFLIQSEKNLEELLGKHRVKFTSHLTKGGHVWANWRHYLHEMLPLLFQNEAK